MKLLQLFSVLTLITFPVFTQEDPFPCATDQVNSELFHKYPELQSGILNATQQLEAFTEQYTQEARHNRSGNQYIIPVVFHVIHDYGAGNISSEQIHDAVRLVNLQYRHEIPDSADIITAFKHLASDTEIEIRLAQLDPDGNCTNGITRTYSPLTNIGDHQVKELIHWPPEKYLNVYICNEAAGLAGHALLPGAADTIPKWDGIVMQHSYVGSIGTSTDFRRTVLTHEIGHYLNLQHIWGGNNVPDFYYLPVSDPGNCAHDDGVADTPTTIGWQSCNLSGTSCQSLDMVQNYMDYSYCSLLFTEGQKDRMHAALNSSIANRNNLWTTANLIATGVSEDTNYLCQTELKVTRKNICAGESVTFSDLSFHGVTSRNWIFEGGDINSSTDSSITVVYTIPGVYDVSLSVSNGVNTIDSLYSDFIEVLENEPTATNITENFEDSLAFSQKWSTSNTDNPFTFERVNYGKHSPYSIYVDNYNGPNSMVYYLESKPIDATQFTHFSVTFDYAYAKLNNSGSDNIQIQISKDCGKTWQTKRVIGLFNGYSMVTNDAFFPTHDSLWKHVEEEFLLSNYNVNNLMVRFQYSTSNGNNLFIDNINFSDISELNVKTEVLQNELRVYPNPANEQLTISIGGNQFNGDLKLFDVFGKCVYSKKITDQNNATIILSSFAEGSYFLIYNSTDKKLKYPVQKVIIAR